MPAFLDDKKCKRIEFIVSPTECWKIRRPRVSVKRKQKLCILLGIEKILKSNL
jgi:hypothetical protein